ncbi:hypothetical protein [Nonomuraea basaltis]|uniref:hypothetical protein n=1 Tax=Nonomuraea basaltis TaxID=2495887 RepID=UPI001F0F4703|nr:hypothetical protein [Nonomuraea basaltis]
MLGSGLDGAWAEFGPGHQVVGSGEATHVEPHLGENDLCDPQADARDLIQPLQRGQQGLPDPAGVAVGLAAVAPAGTGAAGWGLGVGYGSDQLLDPGGERDDLTIQAIDLVQQHPGRLGVVVIEPASQRLDQLGVLGYHLAAGQAGQLTRVAFSGEMRFDHAPRRQRGDGP